MKRLTAILASLALAACTTGGQDEFTDGVIMPGPDAESWGIAESAILFSDVVLNGDGTATTTLQVVGAAVSDDEMGAAPALICEDALPNVLSTEVRSPTATEALGDGTLMMIVTCGA